MLALSETRFNAMFETRFSTRVLMLAHELKQPALSQDVRKSEMQDASDDTALGPNADTEIEELLKANN